MKKTLILASVLGALASAPAFAKTEGNYVGVDVIASKMNFSSTKIEGQKTNTNGYGIKNERAIAGGVNYKYAINSNNVFIAPGVFADYTNLKARDKDSDNWNMKYRYGAKVDVGYDITNEFAIYANAGVAANAYKVNWKSEGNVKSTDVDFSPIYGGGIKFSANSNTDLSVGYDISKVTMKDPLKDRTKFKVQTVRVGVAYKF